MENNIFDVIIIGSGPAGLTAGIYTVRAGLSTLMISGVQPGGQLTQTTMVENFPGFPAGVMGPQLMENMRKQATGLGVIEVTGIVEKVEFKEKSFKVWVGENLYLGRSVIIATGTETKWLGIPTEKKFIGRGLATCATCDGFFYKDKKVVVVGGGDTALEEALFLTKFASEVTVIHRRDSLRASKVMQERVMSNPKISFVWNSVVEEVKGDDNVKSISIKNIISNETSEIVCDGVFVAIGHRPNTTPFTGQVKIDDKGFILTSINLKENQKSNIKNQNGEEETIYKMMTSVEGVFAAGDVHDNLYKQAITAAGFGCMAALEVEKWLGEKK